MVLRRGHRRPISGSGRGTLGSFCRSARRCRCSDRNLGSHLKVLTPGQPIYVSAPAPLATRLPVTENNSKNQSRALHDSSPKLRRSRRPDARRKLKVSHSDDARQVRSGEVVNQIVTCSGVPDLCGQRHSPSCQRLTLRARSSDFMRVQILLTRLRKPCQNYPLIRLFP